MAVEESISEVGDDWLAGGGRATLPLASMRLVI